MPDEIRSKRKVNQQGNVINASAVDGGNTNLDPMQPDGLHRDPALEEEIMVAGGHRSEEVDKMTSEIEAAEDNLLMWQEKYAMEVRREAVTAQEEAKMALEAAEQKFKEVTDRYKPEHLTRSEVLPVPPKFKPPLPIEEIKKEIQPKTIKSKSKAASVSKKKKKK